MNKEQHHAYKYTNSKPAYSMENDKATLSRTLARCHQIAI